MRVEWAATLADEAVAARRASGWEADWLRAFASARLAAFACASLGIVVAVIFAPGTVLAAMAAAVLGGSAFSLALMRRLGAGAVLMSELGAALAVFALLHRGGPTAALAASALAFVLAWALDRVVLDVSAERRVAPLVGVTALCCMAGFGAAALRGVPAGPEFVVAFLAPAATVLRLLQVWRARNAHEDALAAFDRALDGEALAGVRALVAVLDRAGRLIGARGVLAASEANIAVEEAQPAMPAAALHGFALVERTLISDRPALLAALHAAAADGTACRLGIRMNVAIGADDRPTLPVFVPVRAEVAPSEAFAGQVRLALMADRVAPVAVPAPSPTPLPLAVGEGGEAPRKPDVPGVPDVPGAPDVPAAPEAPAARRLSA